jgi:hypothetical protein
MSDRTRLRVIDAPPDEYEESAIAEALADLAATISALRTEIKLLRLELAKSSPAK